MLARAQGGERDGAMEIRPSPDHDRVGVRIGDGVLPLVVDAGNAEPIGDALGRFARAVADADDFDARDLLEQRDVFGGRVRAGANDADSYGLIVHTQAPTFPVQAANRQLNSN